MGIRVACFATTFLGFMYGLLSLMGGVKTDVIAGLVVALAGIAGWTITHVLTSHKVLVCAQDTDTTGDSSAFAARRPASIASPACTSVVTTVKHSGGQTMNDTRLWPIKEDIESGLRTLRTVVDGPRIAPARDSDLAYKMLHHLVLAHKSIVDLMHSDMPLCMAYNTCGSCCYRQSGHTGAHRSEWGTAWTDESTPVAGAAIAEEMKGRRD
jgi:hypothetical protein